ncbi:MAG: alkaline phosphatase family protein [Thermoplasmatota archaeon]
MSDSAVDKVLVLGIDAVEYDLVEKWDLDNLKQEEYGKTRLPLRPDQEAATVIIWPCFITGKEPRAMGYSTIHVFPQPMQAMIELIYPHLRKMFIDYEAGDVTEKKAGKQSMLDRAASLLHSLNLAHSPSRSDIKADTMFDDDRWRSVHLHVPVYDDDAFPSYRRNVVKAIEEKAYRPILEMACKQEFRHRARELMDWLERKDEWDLLMQYFFVLDAVQHVFFANEKKMAEFYLMFDEFVSNLRRQIDDDMLLLIVSDHGQKKGIHTNYGFYSVNKPLGLKNPNLIDFRRKIKDFSK